MFRASLVLLAVTCSVAPLAAHDGSQPSTYGMSTWDAAALVVLAAAALLHVLGSSRLTRRGARVRPIERLSFWAGWGVLVASVMSPVDRAAAALFSAHMAQHELLMLVGAPLVVLGRPIVPWLWALPARIRSMAAAGLRQRGVSGLWQWATLPVVAWALHGLTLWMWHLPAFYEGAVRSEALHAFQHATFIGTAMLFWWGLIYGRSGRAGYGASVLFVFTTMVHTGLLGAAFAFSTTPYYAIYRERAVMAAVDPVADQQLAGLVMWIPAGLVLLLAGLVLLAAWLDEAARRMPSAMSTAPRHSNPARVVSLAPGHEIRPDTVATKLPPSDDRHRIGTARA